MGFVQTPQGGMFIDGKFNDPKKCPQSIQKPGSEKMWCSKPGCKGECEGGYGFAGDYGLGSYSMCVKCSLVHDFFEDEG